MTAIHFPPLIHFAESSHQIFRDWEGVTGFDVVWQVALIIFFVLLNGFFVAAEFAIVKVRTSQIDELMGDARAGRRLRTAKEVVSRLDNYLAATQLGITMASVALSMFGERYIERLVQPVFHRYLPGIGDGWIPIISFALAFGILTFLHVVFGELMPKSLAIRRSLATTLQVAKPLTIFEKCFRWAIRVLNGTANWLLKRLFKLAPVGEHELVHSAEELQLLVAESHRSKQVTPMERDISINALELNDRVARDVMTPRTEIIALDPREDFQHNLQLALSSQHTRFPLREKNLDVCLGVVHIKDFFTIIKDAKPDMVKIKRDILIVPETQPLDECLKTFLAKRAHMALVVDEFGATVGMVTLEDVLEELVGEIEDEFDEPGNKARDESFDRISEDEFFVDGKLPLYALSEKSDVDLESDEVSTIGGYVTSHLGHLPAAGEQTIIEGYVVTITAVDSRKILRLQFRRKSSTDTAANTLVTANS
jgi:CBS domain containing-hemolysin-like protein